ncbi:xanthine dehydrogenase [uncultured Rhodoblastus sp.]|uniref:xanthine dehydrogenase n=1 Tax=uncultured Rhodoblastus sp. TaxID=543037 RepID=UPI0025E37505|nr:xanthine dehydrogenase [uncultured Rhodoblastus sp.]
MSASKFAAFFAGSAQPFAVILGTNEIASAVAVKLRKARFNVLLSHDPYPPVIRRGMAFYDALFDDRAVIDGVLGRRAETAMEIAEIIGDENSVAVTPLQLSDLLALRRIPVLIDARMQKRHVTPDFRYYVGLAVGLGPNFMVGANCDIAVETRPLRSGAIVEQGATDDFDGVASPLGGVGGERFVYAPGDGVWHTPVEIGAPVFRGLGVGNLNGQTVAAPLDGVVRGLARDGVFVPAGVKLLEVDPRGRRARWTGIDARNRAIADATVQAIRQARKRRKRAPRAAQTFV